MNPEKLTYWKFLSIAFRCLWSRFRCFCHCLVRFHRSVTVTWCLEIWGVEVPMVLEKVECDTCGRVFYDNSFKDITHQGESNERREADKEAAD